MTNQTLWLYGGIGVMAVLLAFALFQTVLLRRQVRALQKKYRYFMTGDDGADLERKLSVEVMELRDMMKVAEDTFRQHELLSGMQRQSLQRVGLVKYDAFGDTGDSLSFSLTILDAQDNGFILSSIVGRDTSRMYIKQVMNGESRDTLSSEEAQSLSEALAVVTPYVETPEKPAAGDA
jgi:hypothetical protein